MSPGAPSSLCVEVLTLFPEAITAFASAGLIGRAIRDGRVQVVATDIRAFTHDKHRTVDDTPYGGGAGMLMRIEPVVAALEHVDAERGRSHRVLLTPAAPRFDQRTAERLAKHDRLTLLCGRYEGIDDRVREHVDEAISIGDFVLNGGEAAALVILEAVARLRQGVLGNRDSVEIESFDGEGRLEHPQYTRPAEFRGVAVPKVLLGGDHDAIARWRRNASLSRTHAMRPDLLAADSHPVPFVVAWPGPTAAPTRVTLKRSGRELKRAVKRISEARPHLITVAPRANPAALAADGLRALLRELTSPGEQPGIALFVPPGIARPEAALGVSDPIFALAKAAAMVDISPPPDPAPLIAELTAVLSGSQEIS